MIASQWFFEEVIRHTPASQPDTYRQVRVLVKETDELAWITLPDSPGFADGEWISSTTGQAGEPQPAPERTADMSQMIQVSGNYHTAKPMSAPNGELRYGHCLGTWPHLLAAYVNWNNSLATQNRPRL